MRALALAQPAEAAVAFQSGLRDAEAAVRVLASAGWRKAAAVPEDAVDQIVQCGLAAPSSKNAQPWRLHVVTSRELLGELAGAVQHAKFGDIYVPIDPATGQPRPDWPSTVAESARVLGSVSMGIFIENSGKFSDGRRTVATARDEVREDALVGYGFELIGLGAAIENMWLAASALGLAGVFMGDVVIAEAAIRARLGLAGDLCGVLALGYAAHPDHPKRMEEDRVVRHR